jgi:hypothetical protein
MRDLMTSTLRGVKNGWFWPLVLLVLPNCTFQVNGLGPLPPILNPGPLPHGDAVMCDIEKFQGATRRCATSDDLMMGISLSSAAEALVTGQHSNVGLDYSPAAFAHCGDGNPEAIDFQGSFPNGFAVCINCGGAIPAFEASTTDVCVKQCTDMINASGGPFPPDTAAFCTANARLSTNFPTSGCFMGACSDGGTFPAAGFIDPRQTPEPVIWDDQIGTAAAGNSLMKVAASTASFDAGAVSDQWISHGDAYAEGEGSENNKSHVLGLALVPGGCAHPADCHDADPSIADINFAISLNLDGRFYVLESGSLITGPDINGSFGTYTPGERFRVKVTDHHDGTAVVTYSRVNGPCMPGNLCPDTVFYTHAGAVTYPLRVDTSFREQSATLANVTIVRIQ